VTVASLLSVAICLSACSQSIPAPPSVSKLAPEAGVPGCRAEVKVAPPLAGVRTTLVPVPDQPLGVATSHDGKWAFVSLPSQIAVMSLHGPRPRLARLIPLPAEVASGAHRLTLTRDGRYLLASAASGAVVIDVGRATRGPRTAAGAVLGRISSPPKRFDATAGAISVLATHDGHYAFVARSRTWGIAVFDLQEALRTHFRSSGFFGTIPLDVGPSAMALSPNGRWLYATTLSSASSRHKKPSQGGTLSVIDVGRAIANPDHSVLRTVLAGCEPVRVITSANGRIVWVAALGSHAVLGFSAARLRGDPSRALRAEVGVGQAPVGLLAAGGGRRLLVADSGSSQGAAPGRGVTVIDTAAALAHRPAVVGRIATGGLPRELAGVPGHDAALLTNYATKELETIDLRRLP
jgi:hypothetical protein